MRRKHNRSPFAIVLVTAIMMALVMDWWLGGFVQELTFPLNRFLVLMTATSQPLLTHLVTSPSSTAISTPTPTRLPTVMAAIGTDFNYVNVHSRPSVLAPRVGTLKAGEQVQVFGRLVDGVWFEIKFPTAPDGKAWVLASLVTLNGNGLPLIAPDGSALDLPTPNRGMVTPVY